MLTLKFKVCTLEGRCVVSRYNQLIFPGAVIIFTGLLARIALKQKFERHNILGMFIIVIGLIYVGLSQTLPFREFLS